MKKIKSWKELKNLENGRGLGTEIFLLEYNEYFNFWVSDGENRFHLGTYPVNDFGALVERMKKYGFDVEYEEKFNLVEFLKASLEPKEFNFNERNFYFTISEYDYIMLVNEDELRTLNCRYFKSKTGDTPHVGATLRNKNITLNQLMDALKELGWM